MMTTIRASRVSRTLLVLGVALAASCAAPVREAARAPIPATFAAAQVERGARLAAVGDCRACHTATGGADFAGGRGLATPFGKLYTPNITPDAATGIGAWSEEDFRRAMREGTGRDGEPLYPAFPYPHFTLVTDEDDRALYAFLMTRPAVANAAPRHELAFPFNLRMLVAFWKAIYLRRGPYVEDPAHDAQWNRGAYLVRGLGHCGACHSPHDALGAEVHARSLEGGEAEGWHAFALGRASAAPVRWTADALEAFMRRGWAADHGVALGPMAAVSAELELADPADVRAMAVYLADAMRDASPPRRNADRAPDDSQGARVYAAECELCHDGADPLPEGGIALERSITVSGEDARDLVNVTLYGIPGLRPGDDPLMPAYADKLDDAQVAALASWLRARYGAEPWADVGSVVREARSSMPGFVASPQRGRHAPATHPSRQK